jgi:hypothetical protein
MKERPLRPQRPPLDGRWLVVTRSLPGLRPVTCAPLDHQCREVATFAGMPCGTLAKVFVAELIPLPTFHMVSNSLLHHSDGRYLASRIFSARCFYLRLRHPFWLWRFHWMNLEHFAHDLVEFIAAHAQLVGRFGFGCFHRYTSFLWSMSRTTT